VEPDDVAKRLREWPGDGQALRDEAADDLEALHANTASLLEIIDVWKAEAVAETARADAAERERDALVHDMQIAGLALNDTLKKLDEALEALTQAEAVMSIVEPRSDKAEYLRILGVVRAALPDKTQEGKPTP
jgi:hypothetical protein